MVAASGVIQNLINGVSRQPAAVRLPTQVENQVNAYSTITRGLRKRPPSRHLAMFTGFPTSGAYYHLINRDTTERYAVAFGDRTIAVKDLDGNAKTVNFDTVSVASAVIASHTLTSLTASGAVENGYASKITVPTGLTNIAVVTTGTFVGTVLVQESTTNAWAGEETTKATITTATTTTVAITSGRYYRCRHSVHTSGSVTAAMKWATSSVTNGVPKQIIPPYGTTALSVITTGTFVGTVLVEESTTGAWAGEQTTKATITTATTTAVTVTSGRYYRARVSSWTSGDITATMEWKDASYLNTTTPGADLDAVTVADYTFVLNKSVTIAKAGTRSPARNPEALVHVVSGNYEQKYKIVVNGAVVAEYSTSVAASGSANQLTTIPANIAMALGWGTTSPNGFYAEKYGGSPYTGTTGSAKVDAYLSSTLGAVGGWALTRYGDVIHIENTNGTDFSISVEGHSDSPNSSNIRVHKGTVETFSDLPTEGPDGFVIKVAGDQNTQFDDYYVKFVPADAASGNTRGTWKETVKSDEEVALDQTTMPHALVREADGTFTFKAIDWDERGVGDIDLVPWPSFIGSKGRQLVFYRNRLGLISDESTVLSKAGSFYKFFPDTVTAQLDSDPIDVAVSHPKVSILNHAVPYNENLILFSGLTQFRLTGDELLTPKTANIKQLAEYRVDADVRPVAAGTSLFFVVSGNQSTGIREFQYDPTLGTKDGPSVTDHIDGYLPLNVADLAANGNLNMLAMTSPDQPNRIYVYKFYWNNNEKLQSSWSYWEFGATDEVLACGFIDDSLIVMINHDDGVSVESIPCDESYVDVQPDLMVCLDRRLADLSALSPSYDSDLDRTTFTLPYPAAGVAACTTDGDALTVVSTSGNDVVISGDQTATEGFIGFLYETRVRLSEFIPKKQATAGGNPVMLPAGKLIVGYLTLTVSTTGYLRAEVGQSYRDTFTREFTGAHLGDVNNVIGQPAFEWGSWRIPIAAPAGEVAIDLVNDSYLPFAVLNGEWQGQLYRRNW